MYAHLTNICQDRVLAEEKSPHTKLQSNDKTIQHCRPKPSPSSTAATTRQDPAQGDVHHQDVQGGTLARVLVQGGGQVEAEEGDAHHVHVKEGMPARTPGKGGGHVQAKEEQVSRLLQAQEDAQEVHLQTEF